jgi:hypothetical protein
MKHHNTLTDDQIHNAKGFSPAKARSISTKNRAGSVEWVKANFTTDVIITTRESVAGDLHHRFFCMYDDFNRNKYAVYIDLNGGVPLALPPTYTAVIRVDCTGGGSQGGVNYASKNHVGSQLQLVLDAHPDFTATDNNLGVVTISQIKTATHSKDVDTGFVFQNNDSNTGNEVLVTNGVGDMQFVSKSSFSSEIEDVEGTEIKSTGETGGTKFLREDGDGTSSWQTLASGPGLTVKEEGVALSTDASSLNFVGSGVVASGTGANKTITITGGGETSFKNTTSWRGIIQISEEGRAATAYTFPNFAMGRYEFHMNLGIGSLGAAGSIGGVPAKAIIPAARVNITTNGTSNYSWIGKILANQTSVGGYLRLYKATLSCEGETPEGFTLNLLATVNVPIIAQYGYFCFDVTSIFPVLQKGDIILPVYDGNNGLNDLTYTNTLELTHH